MKEVVNEMEEVNREHNNDTQWTKEFNVMEMVRDIKKLIALYKVKGKKKNLTHTRINKGKEKGEMKRHVFHVTKCINSVWAEIRVTEIWVKVFSMLRKRYEIFTCITIDIGYSPVRKFYCEMRFYHLLPFFSFTSFSKITTTPFSPRVVKIKGITYVLSLHLIVIIVLVVEKVFCW